MRKLPKREGFTLIELMITMVIISVLAMIGVSVFWRAKDRGLEASLQSDLKTAGIQQELYFDANRYYASTVASLTDFQPSPGVNVVITHSGVGGWAGVATHPSLTGTRCGFIMGNAPAGIADPADEPGIVMCTHR